MTKTHMITDKGAISVAQQIAGLRAKFEEAGKELQDRFDEEAKAISKKFNDEREILWDALTQAAGVPDCDKETGFGYEIDQDYIEEHGVLFLRELDLEKDEECDCPGCRALRADVSLGDMLAEALGGR